MTELSQQIEIEMEYDHRSHENYNVVEENIQSSRISERVESKDANLEFLSSEGSLNILNHQINNKKMN